MKTIRLVGLLLAVILAVSLNNTVLAKSGKTILFIPHDNRPISFEQTAQNIRDLGYTVLTPPEKFLGNREKPQGNPEKLAAWAIKNIPKADAAVIASDSMIYGSLVASRKHELTVETVSQRAENIAKIHEANPKIKLYVFGSIMRTPHTAADSGGQDDAELIKYVEDISDYTSLKDKEEQHALNSLDSVRLKAYEEVIPQSAIDKWLSRRNANFAASSQLIDLTKNGTIDYLVLGCDDNAPFSQTNRERRKLDKYAQLLTDTHYSSIAGIDELSYILLARAINNLERKTPTISVHYANGVGGNTIPAASNEPIAQTIAKQINIAGGKQINDDNASDFLFMVNTSNDGATGAANDANNVYTPNDNVQKFVNQVDIAIKSGKKTAIADITFGNGADNSLMYSLYQHNLLDKLNAYSGWNTPTNSTGYAIAMGMSSLYAEKEGILKMLEIRYLDDWLYQANVRQNVFGKLSTLKGLGSYTELNQKRLQAEKLATEELQQLVLKYGLNKFSGQNSINRVKVTFPWNRMYEAAIIVP